MHGGGPPVTAGQPLDATYGSENVQLLTAGCCNLQRHIANMAAYGVPVVVAINRFATDTDAELAAVKQAAMDAGARCPISRGKLLQAHVRHMLRRTTALFHFAGATAAVVAEHHAHGGKGAVDLAKAVVEAAQQPSKFKCVSKHRDTRDGWFSHSPRCPSRAVWTHEGSCTCRYLYKLDQPIKGKIEAIAASYGASSVEYTAEAEAQVERYTKQGFDTLPICIAKTQYSFSADASAKGAPSGFSLPVREVSGHAVLAAHYLFAGPHRQKPLCCCTATSILCGCRSGPPSGLGSWSYWWATCQQSQDCPPGLHSSTSTLMLMARLSG